MTKHEANKTKAVNSGPADQQQEQPGSAVAEARLKKRSRNENFGQKLWSSISSGQSPRGGD